VEKLLAVIGDPGETWAGGAETAPDRSPSDATPADGSPADPDRSDAAGSSPAGSSPAGAAPIVGRLEEADDDAVPRGGRVEMLPAVRRLAGELGVDPQTLVGSGPGGRITEDAVRTAAAGSGPVRRVPMSPLRRTIAANLVRSWREIPHVTTYGEADATTVLAERTAAGGVPLVAVLIRRLLPLLVAHPVFNASVVGHDIVHRLHYVVGFAVDSPDGLLVAVIHDTPSLDLDALAAEIRRRAGAARARTASGRELRGQTFTRSTIGAVGGRFGTPIVPYGTTAILSVGRADPRPVVRDGEIVIGRELPLSLSYDHRAIDGSAGRAFMAAVIAAVEAPGSDEPAADPA
jgi:pyruvate dehydrogenase E2 component (dihydrolipoamide acetyltransferase)